MKNIGWLSLDKVFRMGVGMIVGVWIARYLGPIQFGSLNYLNAIVAILITVSTLGMDSIVVKEIVATPEKSQSILSTVFTLRLLVSIIFFIIGASIMFFDENLALGLILCLTLFFNPLNAIDLFYQSKVLSKYTVIAQNIAFFIVTILRVIFILSGASLIAFGIALLVESILSGFFLLLTFKRISKEKIKLKMDLDLVRALLEKSWPLLFSSLMIVIYMKIDQIMLGQMIGSYEVGVYSSALRLSEIWYFIPLVICNSFYPSLILAKKSSESSYLLKIQKLLYVLFLVSFPISIFFSFLSTSIIDFLYGDLYHDAGLILSIHIWTAIFVFLGVGGSIFFVIEDLHTKAFTRSILGAIINVALNFILIPKFLAIGAAVATLISQFFSTYLFDAFSSKTLPLFIMKTKALVGYDLLKKLFN